MLSADLRRVALVLTSPPYGPSVHGQVYYTCRSRQTKDARACTAQRLPADDLEGRVIGALLGTYDNLDLFDYAVNAAIEDAEHERPGLEEKLASTEAQIRDTTAALDRYLRAFDAGTMPDTVCAPRLKELASRRQELVDYRDKLADHLGATTVPAIESLTPEPDRARAQGTAVRMGLHQVELRGIEPLASSMRPRRSAN